MLDSRDQQLFVEQTLKRVEQLINRGIWSGIDNARCISWHRQFADRGYQLLGACLLDNLIFRCKDQLVASLSMAMTSNLAAIGESSDSSIVDALRLRQNGDVRLVPVIRYDQPPTKSGTYVLRLLAKALRIADSWMIWPEKLADIPKNVRIVIMVDDFCGTGTQFVKFAKKFNLNEYFAHNKNCIGIYITGAAHTDGLGYIKEHCPNIKVIAGEVLGAENHFFDGGSLEQYSNPDVKAQFVEQYKDICDDFKLGGSHGYYGYGGQALTYAFSHATPNNTLPVFWYGTDRWTALLDR